MKYVMIFGTSFIMGVILGTVDTQGSMSVLQLTALILGYPVMYLGGVSDR